MNESGFAAFLVFGTFFIATALMGGDDTMKQADVAYAEEVCANNEGWMSIEQHGLWGDHLEVVCWNGARFENGVYEVRNAYVAYPNDPAD